MSALYVSWSVCESAHSLSFESTAYNQSCALYKMSYDKWNVKLVGKIAWLCHAEDTHQEFIIDGNGSMVFIINIQWVKLSKIWFSSTFLMNQFNDDGSIHILSHERSEIKILIFLAFPSCCFIAITFFPTQKNRTIPAHSYITSQFEIMDMTELFLTFLFDDMWNYQLTWSHSSCSFSYVLSFIIDVTLHSLINCTETSNTIITSQHHNITY